MSATRKKPPARAPEETRSKLVEAAGRLFNSVGYFGTDSNRIAREAGYAPGTFYVHFADKREIFLEVYRGWVSSEWQAIAAAIAPEKLRRSARKVFASRRPCCGIIANGACSAKACVRLR